MLNRTNNVGCMVNADSTIDMVLYSNNGNDVIIS